MTGFPTRRDLLVGFAGVGLAQLELPILRGQSVTGNRILVCIYSSDGNDSNNVVVPLESGRYAAYARARGQLALEESSLLTVRTGAGAEIGFHPSMLEMRDLFQLNRLAVVANTGSPAGRPRAFLDDDLKYMPGGISVPQWAAAFTSSGTANSLDISTGSAGIGSRGIVRLTAGSNPSPLAGAPRLPSIQFPATFAGAQLSKVAAALARVPNQAQFFFVPLPSFGTGVNQLASHASAMRDLSQAMAAFYEATVELGIARSVTTYTDGVFNRTMAPGAFGRATPAWGGHQLVIGDSVFGGQIYGHFPNFTLGGPDDAGKTGIWIPSTGRNQYHAALARWAGVPESTIERTLPVSPAMPQPDLGFLA